MHTQWQYYYKIDHKLLQEEDKIRSKIFKKRYLKYLPADKKAYILDIGCGRGIYVKFLQELGYKNCFGIDISQELVDLGISLGVKNLIVSDYRDFLSTRKEFFDMIISTQLIEHLNYEEALSFLKLCYESIKNNGSILIETINAEFLFFGISLYGDLTHKLAFTSSSLANLAKMAGFSNVSVFAAKIVYYDFNSFLRYLLRNFVFRIISKALLAMAFGDSGGYIKTPEIVLYAKKA
ncbi:MAG: class I SAM-dependent methyltransferase [bacterium]|nr:class I SAM-dependent methyltransferase [bacterium]